MVTGTSFGTLADFLALGSKIAIGALFVTVMSSPAWLTRTAPRFEIAAAVVLTLAVFQTILSETSCWTFFITSIALITTFANTLSCSRVTFQTVLRTVAFVSAVTAISI